MPSTGFHDRLDRHALVLAIWLAAGFVAAVLFDYGIGNGGPAFLFAGAGALIAGFLGHVIVNAVYRTTFSRRELALALVLYLLGLVWFGLATLLDRDFASRNFTALSVGFIAIGAVVVGYMILHFGVGRTFRAFDIIGDFGAKDGGSDVEAEP